MQIQVNNVKEKIVCFSESPNHVLDLKFKEKGCAIATAWNILMILLLAFVIFKLVSYVY